jgi:Flp pilus assembly protein TadG
LVLLLLLAVTLAVIEFGMSVLVQQAVVAAANAGARELAKGASSTEVAAVISQRLQVYRIRIHPHAPVCVTLETGTGTVTFGDPRLGRGSAGPELAPNEVRVTIAALLSRHNRPVPNWLAPYGVSLSGKLVRGSSLALLE